VARLKHTVSHVLPRPMLGIRVVNDVTKPMDYVG